MAAMISVWTTISRTGFQPISTMSPSRVFMPSAAMAATRHQRDKVLPEFLHDLGHRQQAVGDDQRQEAGDKQRQDRRPVFAAALAVRNRPTATITGASIATRISLTTVPVSPASVEMA